MNGMESDGVHPLTTVYLSLGGNQENSWETIEKALDALSLLSEGFFEVSSFYHTSPVGDENQNAFINVACRFQTTLAPKALLEKTQRIENNLGKVPKPKWAPRVIDIDILFYGIHAYADVELEIPHPRWKERLFVLVPLLDLIPALWVKKSETVLEHYELEEMIHTLSSHSLQWVVPAREKNNHQASKQ